MALLRLVEAQYRTQWEIFNNKNQYATGFLVNTGIAIFSTDMIGVLLGYRDWRGIRYTDENGDARIGYGIGDPDLEQGMTETEAYGELISHLRNRQRIVRSQLPIFAIPQSVYDALVSLYVDTGSWRVVQAEEGTYDISDAIANSNWLLAADMLMRGSVNPDLRRSEARVLYLGQYDAVRDRQMITTEGAGFIRRQYAANALGEFERKQAEFVYYRQFGAFLPTMPEARQRRVVSQTARPTDGRDSSGYIDLYPNATGEIPPV